MSHFLLRIILFIYPLVIGLIAYSQTEDDINYSLVWSDEFDYEGVPNPEKWHHQTVFPVGNSWFNGELQHYTDRLENSFVENGILKLVAKKETFTDQGVIKQYTSVRLNSKFAFTEGKVEVRAKIPAGAGTWPAIWTLGKNIIEDGGYWNDENGTTNWPACGEIDIMEHWGSNQNFIQSAMHTPSSFGGTVNKGGRTISTAISEFYVYELEWTETEMVFSVDGIVHYTYQPSSRNDDTWPFNSDQYLLLNIAIEGNMPSVNPSFSETTMEIDYVRVYQETMSTPPIFAAPSPTESEEEVISIYSDSYEDVSDLDFSSHGTAFFEEVSLSENKILKYSLNAEEDGNFQTIEFPMDQKLNIEKLGATNFQFDAWFSDFLREESTFKLKILNDSGEESIAELLIDKSANPSISQGKWIAYNFTIGELKLNGLTSMDAISQIVVDVEGCGTIYLDNIYFYGATRKILGKESEFSSLKIYPNPVVDFVKIDLDTELHHQLLRVYDVLGKVYDIPVTMDRNSMQLDVSELEDGSYIIHLETNKSIETMRFQKKKF
ncbi:MAG: family 16 glycosylhydrolase [Ekhidna sp.]